MRFRGDWMQVFGGAGHCVLRLLLLLLLLLVMRLGEVMRRVRVCIHVAGKAAGAARKGGGGGGGGRDFGQLQPVGDETFDVGLLGESKEKKKIV